MGQKEGIELPGENHMREVNLKRYKYLEVLQLDFIMNGEMREKVKSEYLRRVKKLLRLQLIRGNVIAGTNAWAEEIIRYGAERVLDWKKEELESISIKTRNVMTMNCSLHPIGNVGSLYLARKEVGKWLISCEECVNVEVQSLQKYLGESEE